VIVADLLVVKRGTIEVRNVVIIFPTRPFFRVLSEEASIIVEQPFFEFSLGVSE
jgi:hypothetical protein